MTGFGPFAGVEENPTSKLCATLKRYREEGQVPEGVDSKLLKDFEDCGISLEGLEVLEVAAESCRSEVPKIVKFLKEKISKCPAVILHLGVASSRDHISLECRGVNEATFRVPDVKGYQCTGEEVVPNSPPVMFSSLRLAEILAELHDRGVKCEMSTDAGRFLCNYVFFQSLHAAKPWDIPVLFVHVPTFKDMDHATQAGFEIKAKTLVHLSRVIFEVFEVQKKSPNSPRSVLGRSWSFFHVSSVPGRSLVLPLHRPRPAALQ